MSRLSYPIVKQLIIKSMAYNNRKAYNNDGGAFGYDQNGRYNKKRDQSYSPRSNGGYNRNNRPQKKHSGARLIKGEKGMFISAWKYTQAGMLSITANFWKDAHSEPSEKSPGYAWECWVVNILNKSTGQKSTHAALYNPKNGKLRISSLNWVINPSAPNGGYCGVAFTKEYKPR